LQSEGFARQTTFHAVRVLDAILFTLLLVGNVLALPIWWWLFVKPLVRLVKWCHNRNRDLGRHMRRTPTRASRPPFD
jgi:hypothetical protein